jgi:bacterioferritin-associated ferredoxin
MGFEDLGKQTLQDALRDPAKFGAPTFKEFCANPEKYRKIGGMGHVLNALSDQPGMSQIGHLLKDMTYVVMGHDCGKSLEKAEQVLQNEVAAEFLADVIMKPELIEASAGKYRCEVHIATRQWFELQELKANEESPT